MWMKLEVPAYHLSPRPLQQYLTRLFGNHEFKIEVPHEWWYLPHLAVPNKPKRRNDNYYFLAPRQLTEEEFDEIDELRGLSSMREEIAYTKAHEIRKTPTDHFAAAFSLARLDTNGGKLVVSGYELISTAPPVSQTISLKHVATAVPPQRDDIVGEFFSRCVIARGEASSVHEATALLYSTGSTDSHPVTTKVAIKHLKAQTRYENFVSEYEVLISAGKMNHPNIVEILHAFRVEEQGVQTFNLLFPLALGNLKQLVRGTLKNSTVHAKAQTLWHQFEGLASGLDYVNNQCKTVHQDIKPSNILLYIEEDDSRLTAKIADFGLAAGLNGTQTRNLGSLGSRDVEQDLWYGAPEIRKQSREYDVSSLSSHSQTDLLRSDLWDLGVIFVEMLTYLVLGEPGFSRFRQYITTTHENFQSDAVTDTRFDDGSRAKPQVFEWLASLSRQSRGAAEVEELFALMLGKASARPEIGVVATRLRASSSCLWSDGQRYVTFTRAAYVPRPCLSDRIKELLERYARAEIDWWPFAQGDRSCPPTHVAMKWECYGRTYRLDIPESRATRYKEHCVPLSQVPHSQQPRATAWHTPSQQASTQQAGAQGSTQPSFPLATMQQSGAGGPSQSSALPAAVTYNVAPTVTTNSRVYWCVDHCWAEPSRTERSIIETTAQNFDDGALFALLRERYNRIRGLRARFLTWKSCLKVDFIKFGMVYDDQELVARDKDEQLPLSNPFYQWSPTRPDDMHCDIASIQIIDGMHSRTPRRGRKTLEMIPQHTEMVSQWHSGTQAWGIHARERWSMIKIVSWIGALTFLGLLFMAMWLAFVDKKDLQNAMVPYTFIATMALLLLAVPQQMGVA